jgi:HlyD family secretion protein
MTALPRSASLKNLLLAAVACASLAACNRSAASASAQDGGQGGSNVSATAVDTPYAAIAAGKVDIEGGLVDIAANRPGIVREVFVQEGDYVKAGDELARQEDEDSRLAMNRTQAELAQAEAQLAAIEVDLQIAQREADRLSRLSLDDLVTRQRYDQARDAVSQADARLASQRATVEVVRARLAEAAYEVDQRIVRAPADGLIVRRYANPGSGASTLNVTAMFQLQPAADRIVRAEVEERSVDAILVGQQVEIVPEADQTLSYPGRVLRIAAVMGARKLQSDNPQERTDDRVVEVVVDARDAPILIGQRVLVKFLEGDGASAPEAISETAQDGTTAS